MSDSVNFGKAVDVLISRTNPSKPNDSLLASIADELQATTRVNLHKHQIDGISWMLDRWRTRCSVIVADEMGLGKTLQTLAFLAYLKLFRDQTGPFLVIAPLSVAPQWKKQVEDFVPSLRVFEYMGSQNVREEQRRSLIEDFILKLPQHVIDSGDPQPLPFDVMVSTYETVLSDIDFIDKFKWRVTVYDEGHRLKNSGSVTHKTFLDRLGSPVSQFQIILTGTPVQNNFGEFWSLVHFLHPTVFTENTKPISPESPPMESVHKLVDLVVLRRLFSSIGGTLKLPKMKQLLIKTEMTKIQSDLYKWALVQYAQQQSPGSSSSGRPTTNILSNLMMTLRKISNHPYLIPGVEPEPFQEGQHIWENSNKLTVLKLLLMKMKAENSRCLIFSNFTSFLDIVQDFLDLENFAYERLDGSIRGEDRTCAISRFDQSSNTSVFLLSTRAGGVGLNLASANWVIFLDTDWNPQMDLQAIARAHRQGQTREVNVYRLISANSIDELIFNRSINKIKLSKSILSETVREEEKIDVKEMKNIIAFGASKLTGQVTAQMPKATRNDGPSGESLPDIETLIQSLDLTSPTPSRSEETEEEELVVVPESTVSDYKTFQGIDYRLPTSADVGDLTAIESIMEKAAKLPPPPKPLSEQRDRFTPISEAERAELRRIAEEQRKRRKIEKWQSMGYTSCSIPILDPQADRLVAVDSPGQLTHLHGSVAHPQSSAGKTPIIVHLVDSSGIWPDTSRLFSSIATAFPEVPRQYHRAKQAQDLHLGEVHVVPSSEAKVALIVCHRNDDFEILKKCLFSLTVKFQDEDVQFHFPRIGDQRGNLYITERIIKRYCCDRGFDAFMYYYQRQTSVQRPQPERVERSSPETVIDTSVKKVNLLDYFKKVTKDVRTEEKRLVKDSTGFQIWLSPEIDPLLRDLYINEIAKYLKGARTVPGESLVDGRNSGANVFVVTSLRGKDGIDECVLQLEQIGVPLSQIRIAIPQTTGDDSIVVMTSELLERMISNSARK